MSQTTRQIVLVGAAIIALIVVFQLARALWFKPPTSAVDVERMTLYAESIHNAATFSFTRQGPGSFPTGDCLEGYALAETTITPDPKLARLMARCEVSTDNNDRPVVSVEHDDGTIVTVP